MNFGFLFPFRNSLRSARNGYYLMGTGGVDQQQIYDAALQENGKRPQDYHVAQFRAVFVAAKREKAWDDAETGVHHMLTCYGKWFTEAHDLPGDTAYGVDIPPIGKLRTSDTARLFGEPLIIGTPDDAIRMIEDYQQRTRFTHLVMAMPLPGVEPRKIQKSMELFAKEVMPHFRRKARKKKD